GGVVAPLEDDPEKWIPVFGKGHCSSNKLERDDYLKKSHHVLGRVRLAASAGFFRRWEFSPLHPARESSRLSGQLTIDINILCT
ncbi:MAG TPA: hypothetical protein VKD43_09315, partial [Xanthobacteraceae bacterium]|nr:hypothetical protein [Xanthobacteraceae bacterium]